MIDFFVHSVTAPDEGDLHDLSSLDWRKWLGDRLVAMDRHGIERSGVCVMDTAILERRGDLDELRRATDSGRFFFTLMPDFRNTSPEATVAAMVDGGFRGITFHSYLQEIGEKEFCRVAEWSAAAAEAGLLPGFCTAYGSKRIYDYYSLPLVAEVARRIADPVVLYHAGGAKVLEAMLLCEMWPNLHLETSFSLSYWAGSSVEADLAFAIRKIGAERVLFGSDAPFVPVDKALADHEAFFEKFEFSSAQRDAVMGGTAAALFAIEYSHTGMSVDDDYEDGEHLEYRRGLPGDEYLALLDAGEDVTEGDVLVSAGNGALAAAAGDGTEDASVVAEAIESVDNAAGADPVRVEIQVV